MNQSVPKALSRAALIILAILVAYMVFSMLSLAIGRGNWILTFLAIILIFAIGIPFLDKAFGDKFPFLSKWPSPSINERIRRYLRFSFGKNRPNTTPQSGKQFIINTLLGSSPFLLLLALAGATSLFRGSVSDTLANLLGATFICATVLITSQFLSFRLSMKYDRKSALLAVCIYAPIMAVVMSLFLVWHEILDDGSFRIRQGIFLFICGFGVFMTAMMTLLHGIRKQVVPPTFIVHPLYQRAEIAVSVISLAAIVTLALFAQ